MIQNEKSLGFRASHLDTLKFFQPQKVILVISLFSSHSCLFLDMDGRRRQIKTKKEKREQDCIKIHTFEKMQTNMGTLDK